MVEGQNDPNSVEIFWRREDVKHYKMDAFFILTGLLIVKVLLLRAIRYRRAWAVLTFILLASGNLITHAMSYVFGLLNDSEVISDLTILWAVFLVVLNGTVDNTTSMSLEENEANRKRFHWDKITPSLWLFFLLSFYIRLSAFWIPVLLLWVSFFLKLREKKIALIYACRSRLGLPRVATLIVEYDDMMRGGECINTSTSTSSMQDYRYLVGLSEALKHVTPPAFPPFHKEELLPEKLATIDKIWECKEKLLGGLDTNGHLKDTCLSFALFLRLLPRFAGCQLQEEASGDKAGEFVEEASGDKAGEFVEEASGDKARKSVEEASRDKAWKFVKDVLLPPKDQEEEAGYERVFRVVELECQFLRDYFYTNYFSIYQSGDWFIVIRAVVVALYLLVSFITLNTISDMKRERTYEPWYKFGKLELLITQIFIYSLIVVELAHIINMITSRWNKVKWVCSYVQNKWWESRLGKVKEWLLCNLCHHPCFQPCFTPWHKKLRQYSLLDSYRHTPFRLRFKYVLDGYVEFPMIGQKQAAPTSLSRHVMEAILLSLDTNGRKLSNGVKSLRRNKVLYKLSWACESKKITPVILVWHIATSMCAKERRKPERRKPFSSTPLSSGGASPEDPNFQVATCLSKYCAYLVVFTPKLLPDHVYMTQWIFEQAVSLARVEMEPQCCSMFNTLMQLIKNTTSGKGNNSKEAEDASLEQGASPSLEQGPFPCLDKDENIFKMGLFLAEQIKGLKDESVKWKVLADFWVELILFLAPSENVNEHAKHLVNGGEFITHLWALLTHGGIVGRVGLGRLGDD